MTVFVRDADFTLHLGDALAVLSTLDAGVANCIVTSPPYYLLRDYDVDGQIGHEDTLGEYVGALVSVFREARRVLADDGTLWLNLGDTYAASPRGPRHGRTSTLSTPERQERVSPVVNKLGRAEGTKPKDLMLVPFEVALALRADGWWLRQVIVWDKPNPIPESAKDRPTTSHEYVLLLSKQRHYWYDADAIAEPASWERWGAQTMRKDAVGKARMVKNRLSKAEISARWPGVSKKTADRRQDMIDGGAPESEPMIARATRNARSVWRIVCAQFDGDHAAVMPTELAARCILAGCPEGGVVLDPFGGAGTTAVAARALGRRSILIELSEDSCAIAADRLSQQSLLTEASA